MLYLKAANLDDWKKEYQAIKQFPPSENGFVNEYYDVDEKIFESNVLPMLMQHSKGKNLPEGFVPCTYYFLWDDEEIVGMFKVRHGLNDALRSGAGHIGYGILKQYRNKGYATRGLALAIEELKQCLLEEEIYMSCDKTNLASLKVQQNNGAYIVAYNNEKYYTRISV